MKNWELSVEESKEYEIMADMKKSRKSKDIEEQLRDAILNCGMTRQKLSQISGIATSQLCFFVNKERSLTMKSAAKVAKALELELKPKKEKGKK